jgi:CHASE2 domain-containing sensor protein
VNDAALPGQGTSRRRLLVVCSAIGLLTALMAASPLGGYLDRVGIDLLQPLRMVLHPPPSLDPAQSPVAIVAIDEESYAALGNFPKVVWTPWLAAVIEALLAAKVKGSGSTSSSRPPDTFVWKGSARSRASTYPSSRR